MLDVVVVMMMVVGHVIWVMNRGHLIHRVLETHWLLLGVPMIIHIVGGVGRRHLLRHLHMLW